MKKVLVVLPIQEKHHFIIENNIDNCEFRYNNQRNVTEEELEWADIILGNVLPPEMLGKYKHFEYIALESAGADAYVKPGVISGNTVLTNATGVYSQAVAEHGLAMTLALMKNLPFYRDKQSDHDWLSFDKGVIPCSSPIGATVLVVGLGDIGLYYAKLIKSLGAYVIGIKRRKTECPEFVDELYTTEEIDNIIPRADIIFSVLPGTKATYHFYDKNLFSKMKKSAIFINCGRGASVDTEALCEALENKIIFAAGCDVFENEPLPETDRAWNTRNMFITPHRAGFFDLPGTIEKLCTLSNKNLKSWLEGKDLINIVDFETGYKK